ncbi:MAG: inositol-3-phosphate synthase [Deltaproteobacteria bacterium]|nr:inositol-3-phosphate synthase [Deltaproteobacteria bacterium]
MPEIRVAVAGVGNCASALLQGIEFYRNAPAHAAEDFIPGLTNRDLGGYLPGDIRIVAAFDIDRRKVGRPVGEAIFAPPNCTKRFVADMPAGGPVVLMGPVLDGVAPHMKDYPEDQTFLPSDEHPCDVEAVLRESGAEILVNYLPVGSEAASRYYAEACLAAGVSLVNCIPVFLASDPAWAERFRLRGIPIVGDDIKSQLGATIVHRALARLFSERGIRIRRTYQLNTGGNTDFLNMLSRQRLQSKKISKTEAVTSVLTHSIPDEDIHIGPSDYVPWQKDNKLCFLRIEGEGFGGLPIEVELRLSVTDSPNSAGVGIEAIRLCRLGRDMGLAGPLLAPSAYFMKHPPVQLPDDEARRELEEFIADYRAWRISKGAAPTTRCTSPT